MKNDARDTRSVSMVYSRTKVRNGNPALHTAPLPTSLGGFFYAYIITKALSELALQLLCGLGRILTSQADIAAVVLLRICSNGFRLTRISTLDIWPLAHNGQLYTLHLE